MKKLVAFFFLAVGCSFAQTQWSIQAVTVAPTGSCGNASLMQQVIGIGLYQCISGTWTSISGGGALVLQTAVQGTGANNVLRDIPSIKNSAYAGGAVCNGTTNDAPALIALAAAVSTTGAKGQIPSCASAYFLDNTAGPINLGAFSGSLEGTSGSVLMCKSQANHCIEVNGSSGFKMSGLTIEFQGSPGARNNSYGLYVLLSSNVELSHMTLTNGPSAGLGVISSSNVKVDHSTVSGMEGNSYFFVNDSVVQLDTLYSSGSGDAGVEFSWYDANSGNCQDIVLNNYVSTGDNSGLNVNACKHVQIDGFAIRDTLAGGISVVADTSTTTTHWPIDVNIGNGILANIGSGNPGNSAVRSIHLPTPATTPSVPMKVKLHDILMDGSNTGANMLQIEASNFWSVDMANISGINSGGECFDLAGYDLTMNHLSCSQGQSYGMVLRAAGPVVGRDLTFNDVELAASDTKALINSASGTVDLLGISSLSDQSTARVTVDNEEASGTVTLAGVKYSVTDSSTPTVTSVANSSFCADWRSNGGAITYSANCSFGALATGSLTISGDGIVYGGSKVGPALASLRFNASGVSLLNSLGTNPLDLNFDSGSGGVSFGNGSSTRVAFVNGTGSATFGSASDLASTTYTSYNAGIEAAFQRALRSSVTASACAGVATLASGTVTVSTTCPVGASDLIQLTRRSTNSSTALGSLGVGPITSGTSFVINSYTAVAGIAVDNSIVSWEIVKTF